MPTKRSSPPNPSSRSTDHHDIAYALPYATVQISPERLQTLLDTPNRPQLNRLWKQLGIAEARIRAGLRGLGGWVTPSFKGRSSASLIRVTVGHAAVNLGIARCPGDLILPRQALYYLALLHDGAEANVGNPLRHAVRAKYWELTGPNAAREFRLRGARHLGFLVCRLRVFTDPALKQGVEKDAGAAEALLALRKAIFRQVPAGIRKVIATSEQTGRARHFGVITAAIDAQIIETCASRWGSVNLPSLFPQGLDGDLDIVARAVRDDLVQRVQQEVRSIESATDGVDPGEHIDADYGGGLTEAIRHAILQNSVDSSPSHGLSPERRAAWSQFWERLAANPMLHETAKACLEGLTQKEMAIRFGITDRAVRFRLEQLARLMKP